MAMTRENLYSILDSLGMEMQYHINRAKCSADSDCGKLKHQPYLEYCIKEVSLYAGADEILEAVRSHDATSRS